MLFYSKQDQKSINPLDCLLRIATAQQGLWQKPFLAISGPFTQVAVKVEPESLHMQRDYSLSELWLSLGHFVPAVWADKCLVRIEQKARGCQHPCLQQGFYHSRRSSNSPVLVCGGITDFFVDDGGIQRGEEFPGPSIRTAIPTRLLPSLQPPH